MTKMVKLAKHADAFCCPSGFTLVRDQAKPLPQKRSPLMEEHIRAMGLIVYDDEAPKAQTHSPVIPPVPTKTDLFQSLLATEPTVAALEEFCLAQELTVPKYSKKDELLAGMKEQLGL
jgi:hypothetical protein